MAYVLTGSSPIGVVASRIDNAREALSRAAKMVQDGVLEVTLSDETTGETIRGTEITQAWITAQRQEDLA